MTIVALYETHLQSRQLYVYAHHIDHIHRHREVEEAVVVQHDSYMPGRGDLRWVEVARKLGREAEGDSDRYGADRRDKTAEEGEEGSIAVSEEVEVSEVGKCSWMPRYQGAAVHSAYVRAAAVVVDSAADIPLADSEPTVGPEVDNAR